MAQREKVLATKSANLSWMPGTNSGRGELIPASCLLTPKRALWQSYAHAHTNTPHPSIQTNI